MTQTLLLASLGVAKLLDVVVGTPLLHIEQVWYDETQAILYEERYLPEALFPGLIETDLENRSLHELLIYTFKITLVRLSYTVKIHQTKAYIAALLGMDRVENAFHIDRLSYTQLEDSIVPAMWYHGVYRTDDHNFQTALQALI